MPVFVPLSRHAQSGKSSFIFKEYPRTIVLAVVRAMHQWYLATSRQKRRKRESAPQAFLRGRTGSYVLCSGFYWGVFLQVFPQILGMGLDPLIPRGKVRCRKACRARPDRVRFAPFVRVRTTWNCRVADPIWKKLKVRTATMQPNARQLLLPAGDRSLIEACLARELHLKVVWHGWTAWAEWKCLFSCQFYNSARLQDGQFPWHFSQGPASTKRRGHSSSWNQAKRWPAVADGWKRRDRQLTSSDPLWQHLWHLLKRLWLLQDGLVSSHVPSSQKLHPLEQHRSSVHMEFFSMEVGAWCSYRSLLRFLNMESAWVGRSTSWIRRWAESHTGWNRESGKHASKSGNSLKLNCHK